MALSDMATNMVHIGSHAKSYMTCENRIEQDLGLQCQTPLRFYYENFICLKTNFQDQIFFGQINFREKKLFSVPKNVVPKKNL